MQVWCEGWDWSALSNPGPASPGGQMNTCGLHIFKDSTHKQVNSVHIFKQRSKRSFELRVSAVSATHTHSSKGPRSPVFQGNKDPVEPCQVQPHAKGLCQQVRAQDGASRALTSCSSASWETPLHEAEAENILPTMSLGLLLLNTASNHILLSTAGAARYRSPGALHHQDNQPWGSPTGSGCPAKQSPPDVLHTPGSFCSEAQNAQWKTGSNETQSWPWGERLGTTLHL